MTTRLAPDKQPSPNVRVSWVLEALSGLAIAWVLSRRLGWHLPSLDLLALAIALMAARFGYWIGVGTALVAGGITLLEAGGNSLDVFALLGQRAPLQTAFAFLLLAGPVGMVSSAFQARVARGQSELRDRDERFGELQARYEILLAAKEQLDQRIVGQVQTISSLYEASRELEVLDTERILQGALHLVERFLGAQAASIYRLDGRTYRLAKELGAFSPRSTEISADHALVARATHERHVVAVRTRAEYESTPMLLIAPLIGPDGAARGLIAIERLPFAQLTETTAELLAVIADWVGRAISKAEAYAIAQDQRIIDPDTGLRRAGYVIDRLQVEWATAQRYKLPLSVLLIRIPAVTPPDPQTRSAAIAEAGLTLQALTRSIDLVGHYRTDDSVMVILPVTPLAGAQRLGSRLAEAIPGAVLSVASNEQDLLSAEGLLKTLQDQLFVSIET